MFQVSYRKEEAYMSVDSMDLDQSTVSDIQSVNPS